MSADSTPDPLKPGWKTSEGWTVAVGHLIAAGTTLGILTVADGPGLSVWANRFIAAAFVVVAALWQGRDYVRQRTALKKLSVPPESTPPSESSFPIVGSLVIVTLLFLGGPVHAQGYYNPQAAPPVRTGLQIGLFNIHRHPQQDQKPLSDPAVVAALQQLVAQNERLISLLSQQRQSSPQYILVPGGPQQALPIAGAPQQQLPIAGPPQQVLPIAGPPQQVLPIAGAPQQIINIHGAPQQQLPIGQAPQQPLAPQLPQQALPQPQQQTPAPGGAPQQRLGQPGSDSPVVGYQRYSALYRK